MLARKLKLRIVDDLDYLAIAVLRSVSRFSHGGFTWALKGSGQRFVALHCTSTSFVFPWCDMERAEKSTGNMREVPVHTKKLMINEVAHGKILNCRDCSSVSTPPLQALDSFVIKGCSLVCFRMKNRLKLFRDLFYVLQWILHIVQSWKSLLYEVYF